MFCKVLRRYIVSVVLLIDNEYRYVVNKCTAVGRYGLHGPNAASPAGPVSVIESDRVPIRNRRMVAEVVMAPVWKWNNVAAGLVVESSQSAESVE